MTPSRHRILMTADAVGGVWQYACSLARALDRMGHELVLAVLGPEPSADQRRMLDGAGRVELAETGLPLDWIDANPQGVRRAASEIAALAERTGATVVHLNSPVLASAAAYSAPVIAVAHGCIGTWWQAARQGPIDPALAWHPQMTAAGLQRCDLAIAPTAAYAAVLARSYRLERTPAVVHNGRRLPFARQAIGFCDDVFTAGRLWDPVKNTAVIDAVAERLCVPVYAAGRTDGPNGERVRPAHLQLLGQLAEPELADWLAARPVFVSAASFEPFGLAVLEAAQAGCALVLADIPSFRELWEGAAVFVEAEDVAGYVRAIETVLGDRRERRRLGDAARERARHYSVEAMATAMLRHYDRLDGRKAAA